MIELRKSHPINGFWICLIYRLHVSKTIVTLQDENIALNTQCHTLLSLQCTFEMALSVQMQNLPTCPPGAKVNRFIFSTFMRETPEIGGRRGSFIQLDPHNMTLFSLQSLIKCLINCCKSYNITATFSSIVIYHC